MTIPSQTILFSLATCTGFRAASNKQLEFFVRLREKPVELDKGKSGIAEPAGWRNCRACGFVDDQDGTKERS